MYTLLGSFFIIDGLSLGTHFQADGMPSDGLTCLLFGCFLVWLGHNGGIRALS